MGMGFWQGKMIVSLSKNISGTDSVGSWTSDGRRWRFFRPTATAHSAGVSISPMAFIIAITRLTSVRISGNTLYVGIGIATTAAFRRVERGVQRDDWRAHCGSFADELYGMRIAMTALRIPTRLAGQLHHARERRHVAALCFGVSQSFRAARDGGGQVVGLATTGGTITTETRSRRICFIRNCLGGVWEFFQPGAEVFRRWRV